MKNILLLMIITFLCVLSAQSQMTNNRVLEAFLNDSIFRKVIVPGFFKYCDTIHIIDTSNYFSNKQPIHFDKIVIIENQYSKKPPLRQWYCFNMVVTLKIIKGKYYLLSYFHEPSNNVGFVKYKLVRNKLKKIKYEHGQL